MLLARQWLPSIFLTLSFSTAMMPKRLTMRRAFWWQKSCRLFRMRSWIRETTLRAFFLFAAPALLFGKFALCFGKSLFFFAEEARVLDELAIGQSGESFQANVNTDGLIGRRQVFGFNLLAEAGEPLAIDAANRAGFEFAPRLAVEFGLHLPDFGKANGAVTDLETVVLRERDAIVLAFAL